MTFWVLGGKNAALNVKAEFFVCFVFVSVQTKWRLRLLAVEHYLLQECLDTGSSVKK